MRHPVFSIHRTTYGLLYRLLNYQHFHLEWWKRNLVRISISMFFFILGLNYYIQFNFFRTLKPYDVSINSDPKVCAPFSHTKKLRKFLNDSLEFQINLQAVMMMEESKKTAADTEKLLPITKAMLDKEVMICPLFPPNLSGPIKINSNLESVEKDLQILETQLTKSRSKSLKLFESPFVTDNADLKSSMKATNNVFSLHTKHFSTPFNQSSIELPLYLDKIPDGVNTPTSCYPHRRTAIIIPYRNRELHLKLFVRHLHDIMMRQQLEYGIYVINLQEKDVLFNRAKLLNIGYVEAMRHYERYDCIIFHDVDLFPEDDRNLYTCSSQPKHMSAGVNIFDYKVPYEQIFGGVSALTPYQFEVVNGYSNEYWGWGGEDDDMFLRLVESCMNITRPSTEIGKYIMIKHVHDPGNDITAERFNLLESARQRMKLDGLSSLKYKVIKRDYRLLYNNITVLIGPSLLSPRNSVIKFRSFIK